MIPRKGKIINSNLPSEWEKKKKKGEKMVIKRQEQGANASNRGKGDKLRTRRGDLVEQVAMVNDE